ncbi:MAG TPA: phosphotransferase [Alphaproteobacteria bacterium]|nr:phosphotransferase [Alphaproteobacteria bacterium]
MSERERQIAAFLAEAGWGGIPLRTMTGDASFRRYARLVGADGRRAVLMDAPPPQENVGPFTALARHLLALQLSAPKILAADIEAGLLLLEDFGDGNMARLVDGNGCGAGNSDREALYALAVDTLIALHGHARALEAPAPPFTEERLLREVGFVLDWYWPALTGNPAPQSLREDYLALWRRLIPEARRAPDSLVLFDFFPDNLMLIEGRAGVAACGLLDFQDAVIGPLTYDLVSLLEDARRDVPADLQARMRARYLAAFPELDRDGFDASYVTMGAQRNLRIVGVFTRLCVRDRKPGYLRHLPRVWRLVEQDVSHPVLAPLKAWLDEHIGPAMRRIPPCEAAA